MSDPADTERPLVLHVLYRFDTGGLENGVVNLINRMPPGRFRHAVLALDDIEPSFAARIQREDVGLHALHKPPGHALKLYPRIWSLLRALKPAVVHSRNLAALEVQPVAALAGVPVRIHGEHGRDVEDVDGTNRKLQRVRRAYSISVHRHVTVSLNLKSYLVERVGIRPELVDQIYNGVDTERFRPPSQGPARIEHCPFSGPGRFLFGTVGRMQTVKNQVLLARAFVQVMVLRPEARDRARLVMVGDGPLRAEAQAVLDAAGMSGLAWLPGERRDIPEVMRGLDAFVLPSQSEGISNSILEAMASGLPVLATAVGGNSELVQAGRTGELVQADDVGALADAMLRLLSDGSRAWAMGREGRAVAERRFSLDAMVNAYAELYASQLRCRSV